MYHWSPAGGGSVSVPPHLFPESGPKARRRLDMEVGTVDDAGVGAQRRQQASAPPGPAKFARNWKQQRFPAVPAHALRIMRVQGSNYPPAGPRVELPPGELPPKYPRQL